MKLSQTEKFKVCHAMRELIFKLDGHKCVRCHGEADLETHHIRYRVPCRTEDIVTLCSKCHGFLHGLFKHFSAMPKFSHAIAARRKRKRDASR